MNQTEKPQLFSYARGSLQGLFGLMSIVIALMAWFALIRILQVFAKKLSGFERRGR